MTPWPRARGREAGGPRTWEPDVLVCPRGAGPQRILGAVIAPPPTRPSPIARSAVSDSRPVRVLRTRRGPRADPHLRDHPTRLPDSPAPRYPLGAGAEATAQGAADGEKGKNRCFAPPKFSVAFKRSAVPVRRHEVLDFYEEASEGVAHCRWGDAKFSVRPARGECPQFDTGSSTP
jgi:hypothetical protein